MQPEPQKTQPTPGIVPTAETKKTEKKPRGPNRVRKVYSDPEAPFSLEVVLRKGFLGNTMPETTLQALLAASRVGEYVSRDNNIEEIKIIRRKPGGKK